MLGAGAGMMLDNEPQSSLNEFDSLWCKISFMDFTDPSHSVNRSVIANEKTCDGKPVDCIVETIQSIGRNANAQSGKPDIQLVSSPTEQQHGKIIGGSLLCAGGIGLLALSGIMIPEVRPMAYVGGGVMVCGGAALLTVGIIKQSKYNRNR
jgi:hypothetical protein